MRWRSIGTVVAGAACIVTAGCGEPTACEELDQKLVAECDQPVPEPVEGCDEGTAAACVSECGLNARCDVLLGTGDLSGDPDYAQRFEFFSLCLANCEES